VAAGGCSRHRRRRRGGDGARAAGDQRRARLRPPRVHAARVRGCRRHARVPARGGARHRDGGRAARGRRAERARAGDLRRQAGLRRRLPRGPRRARRERGRGLVPAARARRGGGARLAAAPARGRPPLPRAVVRVDGGRRRPRPAGSAVRGGAPAALRLRAARRAGADREPAAHGDRAGGEAGARRRPAAPALRHADASRTFRRRLVRGARARPRRAGRRRPPRRARGRRVSGRDVRRPSRLVGDGGRRRRARAGALVTQSPVESRALLDPVALSVFVSALSGIAEEMGAVLVRSSYSSNIKERRDCSCALFDADGRMVAQAEHIPVHLGAMHEAVEAVRARSPEPGDVFIVNDPFSGGTHLPDITLVSPIDLSGEIVGYAVSRAHHSDVGGMTPGSMPSESRSIYQEGIVIPPLRLVRGGALVEEVLELVLANVRTPEIRRVDLLAQAAANTLGAERLRALAERHGLPRLRASFDEVIAYGERRTRAVLVALPDGTFEAEGELE